MSRRDAVYARQSVEKRTASPSPASSTSAGVRRGRGSWRFIRTRATPEKIRIDLPFKS